MKRVDLSSRTTVTKAVIELVLIVAGILIALAVDGAISERRDRAAARASLELVREDLRLLVEQVEEFRAFNEALLASSARATRLLSAESALPRTTETWNDLVVITNRRTLRLPRAAWDELVGTGNLRLLEDATLRRDLVRFYETVARDQEIVSRNNLVFADDLGVGVLMGEGLVLSHRLAQPITEIAVLERRIELLREAGIETGPTFRGRIWTLPSGHPDRIRAESVALGVSDAAAGAISLAEGIQTQAHALIERIDLALADPR